jgi:hypothetical protein
MPTAGYNTQVNKAGSPTAFTTEACTGATTAWQITNTSKRAWSPATTPSFFDNGVPIAGAQVSSIDYLFGRVVFTVAKTGPITVTGSYLPMAAVAEAKEFTFSASRDILDTSVFSDTVVNHTKMAGLKTANGSVSLLDTTVGFTNLSGSAVLLEFWPGQIASSKIRVWAMLEGAEVKASVDGLVESSFNWQSCTYVALDGTSISFSISG